MTKLFVPFFAAAMLVAGAVNAQKPAPAVKKVAPPVNKMPVPVARPVVPVTKPAPPVTRPAAAPVVAKPAPAPAPVVAKPAPAPKPVPVAKPAPARKPAVAAKPAPVKKAPAKKAVVRKAKKVPVAQPAPLVEDAIVPRPVIRDEERPVRVVIREEEDIETEKESSNAPCAGSYHSINNCSCYKACPDDCMPWKFRNRRYYRYNYTLQHYRNHKHESCGSNSSCGYRHKRRCCK